MFGSGGLTVGRSQHDANSVQTLNASGRRVPPSWVERLGPRRFEFKLDRDLFHSSYFSPLHRRGHRPRLQENASAVAGGGDPGDIEKKPKQEKY